MSQTETLMVLVLGAVLTLVLVLFFARLIWNIGQRIARRRAEKAKPALIRELESDRDQLRASHAMMSQRLSSGLAEAKARVVSQMAEVSRHRNRLMEMTATINSQATEIAALNAELATLQNQTALQETELNQRADLIAQMRSEAAGREEDIQMLKSELQKTASLVEDSRFQLERLEAQRSAAVERYELEREEHARELSRELAQRDMLQRAQAESLRERTIRPEPVLEPDPQVMMVKPADSTQPQRRYGFAAPDDGLTLPPVPQRPARPNELANLLQNARRTMMDRQAEARKTTTDGKRSGAIANVVAMAQKIRSEREE